LKILAGTGIFFLLLWTLPAVAQIKHPKASPFATVRQDIGLSAVTVEYSRPAVKGRELFGGLVPFGRIWRVGANESTKFTTTSELEILGNELAQGTYALYAFPEKDTWEVVFHKNTAHWGDGRTAYNPAEDAFRIKVTPQKTDTWQENFLISFDSIRHNGALMQWKWGYTSIAIPITVNTREIMLESIEEELRESPTAQTYYEAARYLQEEGIEYTRALKYLDKAIGFGGDTYYFYRVRSLVLAALEDYKGAVKSAQRSRSLAEEEGKDEFVRMNQENITKWKKLIKE
jgi:tetratricopeptide (TPR) repeat protein